MGITVKLIEEERIVFVEVIDPWTHEDLEESFRRDTAYREVFSQTHPDEKLHFVVDVTHGTFGVRDAGVGRKNPSFYHPTRGTVVAIGVGDLAQKLVQMVMNVLQLKRYHFVASFDEAVKVVRKERGLSE